MSRIAKFLCVEFGVFEMKLLVGRALDGMEGGPVFVRMGKLESDKSNIRSLGNIIVFKDGVQFTFNCSRLTGVPSRFGIARVPSPGNLGLIWNLKFGKIFSRFKSLCVRIGFKGTFQQMAPSGKQKQQHSNLPQWLCSRGCAEWVYCFKLIWSGYCGCFEKTEQVAAQFLK